MGGDEEPRTRKSLLLRLRDLENQDAWEEFLDTYAPKVYGWCRNYQLQEADASDVTQDVLRRLVGAMRSFDYDPSCGSFRGWLKTVTNNAIRDFHRALSRPGRGSGDTRVQQNLSAIQAPDAIEALTYLIEQEGEHELLREAEERVKLRVQHRTWEAYRLTAVESCKAREVADRLAISVAEVYVAKSRVIKMLREEIAQLDTGAS
jgi:RNA polymerase sigma-70 factor (ECF subfamily)